MALRERASSPAIAGTRQLLGLLWSTLVLCHLVLICLKIARRGSALLVRAGHELLALPETLGLVACPLRRLTGIACPACGATRAALALDRGDLAMALTLNPFLVLALAALLISGTAALVVPQPTERWIADVGRFAGSGRGRILIVLGLAIASAWQTVHLPN